MDVKVQALWHFTCHQCHRQLSVIDFQRKLIDHWSCPYCLQPYYGMLEVVRNELVALLAQFEVELNRAETSIEIETLRKGSRYDLREDG